MNVGEGPGSAIVNPYEIDDPTGSVPLCGRAAIGVVVAGAAGLVVLAAGTASAEQAPGGTTDFGVDSGSEPITPTDADMSSRTGGGLYADSTPGDMASGAASLVAAEPARPGGAAPADVTYSVTDRLPSTELTGPVDGNGMFGGGSGDAAPSGAVAPSPPSDPPANIDFSTPPIPGLDTTGDPGNPGRDGGSDGGSGAPVTFTTTSMGPDFTRGLDVPATAEPTAGFTDLGPGVLDPAHPAGPSNGPFSRDPRLADPTYGSQPAPAVGPSTPAGSPSTPAAGAPAPDGAPGGSPAPSVSPPASGPGTTPSRTPAPDRTQTPAAESPPGPGPRSQASGGTTILGTPVLDKNLYAPTYAATGVPFYGFLNAKTIQIRNPGVSLGRAGLAGSPALLGGFARDTLLANHPKLFDDPVANSLANSSIGTLLSIGTQELGKQFDPAFNRALETRGIKRPGEPTFSLASPIAHGTYAAAFFGGPVVDAAIGKGLEATGLQDRFPYQSGLARAAVTACAVVGIPVSIQFRQPVWEACWAPAAQATAGYVMTTPGSKGPLADALMKTCSDEDLLYGTVKQLACEPRSSSSTPPPPGQSPPATSPVSFTPVPPNLTSLSALPGAGSPAFGSVGSGAVVGVQRLAGTGEPGSSAGVVRTVRGADGTVVVQVQPSVGPTVGGVRQVSVPMVAGRVTGWNPAASGTALTVVPDDGVGRVGAGTRVWSGSVRVGAAPRLVFNGGGRATAVGGFADRDVYPGDPTKEVWRIFAAQDVDGTTGVRTWTAQVPQGATVDLAAANGGMIEVVVPAGTRPVAVSQRVPAFTPSASVFHDPSPAAAPAPVSVSPALQRAPSGPAVPLGPPAPAPAPAQRGWWEQAGDAARSFVYGPMTMRALDGDPITHVGSTRFEARFLDGRVGVYDTRTGDRISGEGPRNIPSWQRPIPPAMLFPTLIPSGGGLPVPEYVIP